MGNGINYRENIRNSGKSIYDPIRIGDTDLWIPSGDLEALLKEHLAGLSLAGLPIRTRSKMVKSAVCEALGYPAPSSFKKTNPRFPGQDFDTYVQKSNNLQIWNEELSPTRRYVLLRVGDDDHIKNVRVVNGSILAELDTTGTLTQKYQARINVGRSATELITGEDTNRIRPLIASERVPMSGYSPTDQPVPGRIMAISEVFSALSGLIGKKFEDAGVDQERNRGAALHREVCKALGFREYRDDGQFPDIKNQLLEIKLQTSPTIDLGLVTPDSESPVDMPACGDKQVRHCDTRYAVFYATTDGKNVRLTHLFVTTGEGFFRRFPRFEGRVLNKKLQIPLPRGFL
ncbi:MAG: restriction endonuclease [Burkholderiales bacterium]|nr:restriction endonuclease [Burkholderiales bacterium]